MNKKEIAQLRKEFKENSYSLKLKELYSVYVKKDDTAPVHKKIECFDGMDIEKKELFYNNFKKVLSSAIDTKLFELDFEKNDKGSETQDLLFNTVGNSDNEVLQDNLDRIIQKLVENYNYDSDVVLNFVLGEYYKGNKKRNIDAEEAIDDIVQSYEFILCSVNKIEFPKKALIFDYYSKEFVANTAIEAIVNLNSPLDGFMFPAFENGYSNVNKVMYYCSKAKELNINFIENILNCETKLTAEDEKECFHSILAAVVGDKVKPEIIQDIYTKINEKAIEDDEIETIGIKDVKKILAEAGIAPSEQLEQAFEETCGTTYDFKIGNVVPDFKSKSIKISNEIADISITPKSLNTVKQIVDENGKKCILIEIDDDVVINGLRLETEKIEK